MGHALNNTLQDVLCRFERMRGKDVLWQPGTDHAGIATQMVVERQLAGAAGADRRTMGREEVRREGLGVEGRIRRHDHQPAEAARRLVRLERASASPWTRACRRRSLKVFVELYKAGLIYKDKRLVNWDPQFQTAISDLEVVQSRRAARSRGDGDPEKPFDVEALARRWRRSRPGTCITSAIRWRRRCRARQGLHRRRHDAARDDAGRHRRRRASRRRALCGADRQAPRCGCRWSAADPDRRRRICRSREGHGRGEDHAGARLQRLRGRQAPQARADQHARRPRRASTTCRRPSYRGTRPLRGAQAGRRRPRMRWACSRRSSRRRTPCRTATAPASSSSRS